MQINNPETYYRISNSYRFQWEEAQQAWVLLYPEGMVTLNGSAGEILSCFQSSASIASVITLLQQKFPGVDTIGDDINEFVNLAIDKLWLVADEQ